MREEIEAVLLSLCRGMEEGNVDGLVTHFKTPLPVYRGSGLKLIATDDDVRHAMSAMCDGVQRINATRCSFEIIEFAHKDTNDTVNCQLTFQYTDDAGQLLRYTTLRYFFEFDDGSWAISMIDYEHPAFEEVFRDPPTIY